MGWRSPSNPSARGTVSCGKLRNERYGLHGWGNQPNEGKYRPVLVIDVNHKHAVVMSVPFTSTEPRDDYDIEVFDWSEIPLDHISTARISKTIVIPISDFRKRLGQVSGEDWNNITDLLMTYMEYHGVGTT